MQEQKISFAAPYSVLVDNPADLLAFYCYGKKMSIFRVKKHYYPSAWSWQFCSHSDMGLCTYYVRTNGAILDTPLPLVLF